MKGKNTRSPHWDTFKGVSILAVIGIHASASALTFPEHSWNWQFGLVFRQCVNFAVPIFLAMSGVFALGRSEPSTWRGWARHATRLLPPYLVWTLVALLLRSPAVLLSPLHVAQAVLMGTGIGIGYYVIVLMQCQLLTPLLLRLRSVQHHLTAMLLLTAMGLAWSYGTRLGDPDGALASFPMYALPFVVWYPFYHLGLWVRLRGLADQRAFGATARTWLLLYLMALALSVAEGEWLAGQGHLELASSQIKASSFLSSTALFMAAVAWHARGSELRHGVLTWLGRHSYPIYLMHGLFVPLSAAIVRRLPGVYEVQPLYVLLTAMLVLGLCAALIQIAMRLVPPRTRTLWLGI